MGPPVYGPYCGPHRDPEIRFGPGFRTRCCIVDGLPDTMILTEHHLGHHEPGQQEAIAMTEHVYKHITITGSSKTGTDDAIRNAIAKAGETVRNIRWFTVTETRGHVVDGKIGHFQVTLDIGFSLED